MVRLFIERGVSMKEPDWAGDLPLDGVRDPGTRVALREADPEFQRVAKAARAEAAERQVRRAAGLSARPVRPLR